MKLMVSITAVIIVCLSSSHSYAWNFSTSVISQENMSMYTIEGSSPDMGYGFIVFSTTNGTVEACTTGAWSSDYEKIEHTIQFSMTVNSDFGGSGMDTYELLYNPEPFRLTEDGMSTTSNCNFYTNYFDVCYFMDVNSGGDWTLLSEGTTLVLDEGAEYSFVYTLTNEAFVELFETDGSISASSEELGFCPGSPAFTITTEDIIDVSTNPVPEPSSLILLGTGLICIARRKYSRAEINSTATK